MHAKRFHLMVRPGSSRDGITETTTAQEQLYAGSGPTTFQPPRNHRSSDQLITLADWSACGVVRFWGPSLQTLPPSVAPPLGSQRESFVSVAREAGWFLSNGHSALGIHLDVLACYPLGGCLSDDCERGHQECFTLCQNRHLPRNEVAEIMNTCASTGRATVFSMCIYV